METLDTVILPVSAANTTWQKGFIIIICSLLLSF